MIIIEERDKVGNFSFIETELPGVIIVETKVFGDERGFFMETWQQGEFAAAGIGPNFVQDNHSKSSKGVLRGLHYQRENTQGKLVRVTSGSVFDVAVDVRPNSPRFGKWVGVLLSSDNKRQLYVPEGFAHGFLVTSDEAEFSYKCTNYYNQPAEGGICYNDEAIGIKWPDIGVDFSLSAKDAALPPLAQQNLSCFERWYKA